MASPRFGKLSPRYSFILNEYPHERLSKCPLCHKLTHPRKFALLVHVDAWGPLALGKTCVYCAPCELIIVHQAELEGELVETFDRIAPAVVGNEYLVLGTVETKIWKRGLTGTGAPLNEMLEHVADFKKVLTLTVDPGGWRPADPGKARGKRRRSR